nr:hypothetical transcript [Hymenolepis microstoma]CUU00208.1 hypothetical transcript [Hymenolepis microstoma]
MYVLYRPVIETNTLERVIGNMEPPKPAEINECKKQCQLLKEKNETKVLQWSPGHCGIISNERVETLTKKRTTILKDRDWSMSFHPMKTLIRREFKTSRSNELKARAKEKQWTTALSDIAD